MHKITTFTDEYAFLSNFFPCSLFAGGTLEHAYQACKCVDPQERAAILAAPTAGRAKRLGSQCRLRPDWEQIKDQVMLDLLRVKFSLPELRQRLLATGDAPLEEGNQWNDRYWGICPAGSGDGLNRLGTLLMQVRDETKQKGEIL